MCIENICDIIFWSMATNQWSYTQENIFSLPYGHRLPIATQLGAEQNELLPI